MRPRRPVRSCLLSLLPLLPLALAAPAAAHVAQLPIEGKKLDVKGDAAKPKKNKFQFQSDKRQDSLLVEHDPSSDGFKLLVVGESGAHSGLIRLDPTGWKPIGKPGNVKGWKYKDKTRSRGGIEKVKLKNGQLSIKGKGENWPLVPDGTDAGYTVWVNIEQEWFCSEFGGSVKKNEQGRFKAVNAANPGGCADQVCGNGVTEFGEACDDGDLDDEDGCTATCEISDCGGEPAASTFDAIQDVVFEGYGCTLTTCHGQANHQSGLSLYADDAEGNYARILNVASQGTPGTLVVPGDKDSSYLYEKLAAGTLGFQPAAGSPMPVGTTLLEEHLEAFGEWIRTGASRDLSVQGTAELLGACLPPATPLKIDPPEVPGAGNGVQLVSSAWPLPMQSENEVCMATYYDLTQTSLVPAEQQFDCPGTFGPSNPSGKCFRYHRQLLLQDAQSHHSIIHIYTGDGDDGDGTPPGDGGPTDPGWGTWTYKFDDPNDPMNGEECDPTDIDPALGFNRGCSGTAQRSPACIFGYGPEDWNTGSLGGGDQGTAPQFSGSQETYYDQEFSDGVYSILPMSGMVVWNSHAFNLTDIDTTMNQYLNLYLAAPADQLYFANQIFDASEIFIQNVPPFAKREYCHSYVMPDGANLFWLSSHTHRFGVQWRSWLPPNAACSAGDCTDGTGAAGVCCPKASPPDYFSTQYNDPTQMRIDPPLVYSGSASDRRILFCAVFDNQSAPGSPSVKRQSTSPVGPAFGFVGGPCADDEVACVDGPKKGQLCGGSHAFCDSEPGAGDGDCDACPVRGGLTTEDEMFILLGNFFVP